MGGVAGVKDCVLEGFDHGILAAYSKALGTSPEPRSLIEGNQIDARFVPVHAVLADNLDIRDNTLTWRTRGGAGVLIQQDSDRITVLNNDITGQFTSTPQGAVLMPGPTARGPNGAAVPNSFNTNPVFNSGHGGIIVSQSLGIHPQLFAAVINGKLYQFPTSESIYPDATFTEDTWIEGNTLTFFQGNTSEDGITVSSTIGTVVQANTIGSPENGANVRQGIRAGGVSDAPPAGLPRQFPATCSQKESRLCLSDFDCNVPGIDEPVGDTCPKSELDKHVKGVFWFPQDIVYEDNTIYGRFQTAFATTAERAVIQGNSVLGLLPSGRTQGIGIALAGKKPLESAIVHRNRISDVATGLRLVYSFGGETPEEFGAEISRNDITGYATAVLTSSDYPLLSELSVQGRGNYWGLACPGFDPTKVLLDDGKGTVQPLVVDSNPYSVLVSHLEEADLPDTCANE